MRSERAGKTISGRHKRASVFVQVGVPLAIKQALTAKAAEDLRSCSSLILTYVVQGLKRDGWMPK